MQEAYLHGATGSIDASAVSTTTKATVAPLIVGTSPVNLVRGYKNAGIINSPIRLANITAKNRIGYSEDWDAFTLSEVVKAFFDNKNGNVGPIYVINVLDPDVHKKEKATTVNLQFAHGRASIASDTIILDTFAIDDKVEGVDYSLSYNFSTKTVVIKSINKDNKLDGTIQASYSEVDPSAVTAEDIIGEKTAEGVYTGLQAGKLLHPMMNVVTNLVVIPKWSEIPAVYEATDEFVQALNGHWYAMHYDDIPLTKGEQLIDTLEKAETWKVENDYTSMFSKVFWPMAKTASGEVYRLSVLAAVETLRVDISHGGIPMETCSNKTIPVGAQYFGKDSKNQGFDQVDGNLLNSIGITTLVAWGGTWVLWGPHTAMFEAGEDGNAKPGLDPLAIFDTNVRIQEYVVNDFQVRRGTDVDRPLSPSDKDTILVEEQEKLDTLVAAGALIGSPKVVFLESDNSTTDLMNGNFKWRFSTTPTPPGKHLAASVSYTDEGFSAFFGEEE